MANTLLSALERLVITPYAPQPALDTFQQRAQTQQNALAAVTVAVPDARESERLFGVPLARRGMQPVYLRIENQGTAPLRLLLAQIDPNYYTPLEAAAANHFSIVKRLSAFGVISFLFFPLLVLVMPSKLISAWLANRRMDELFRSRALHLRPVAPGGMAEGFVFTPLDAGTKNVHVALHATGESLAQAARRAQESGAMTPDVEFVFSIPVPGLAADYLRRDFAAMEQLDTLETCDEESLVQRLRGMPPATSNAKGTRSGDPANLAVVGEFEMILGAFAARWDESETITLATCWKTTRSFLLGSQYRYSPVSALYLFGRSQDIALQRSRRSINERLHLRLWLTPLRFNGLPVWVGQVSRDIGVRFTTRTWNLTTHRVDPDVDEARDYVIEDLLQAERIEAAGYVEGVGACEMDTPRHNLTGDPYFTDGKRAVVLLSPSRTQPRFVAWS